LKKSKNLVQDFRITLPLGKNICSLRIQLVYHIPDESNQ